MKERKLIGEKVFQGEDQADALISSAEFMDKIIRDVEEIEKIRKAEKAARRKQAFKEFIHKFGVHQWKNVKEKYAGYISTKKTRYYVVYRCQLCGKHKLKKVILTW